MATLPWFIAQALLALAAVAAAAWIARQRKRVWGTVCIAAFAVMLLWPLMRFFPVIFINLLGAPVVACTELTGLAIPAALLFSIAAFHVPKPSDRRAIRLLLVIAGVYFLKAGWWMAAPAVGLGRAPELGNTKMVEGSGGADICLQSTEYTCVAASLATALRARGIDATETEMARLAHVQPGGGATDSRALWALQRKLRGTGLHARYLSLDQAGLAAAAKPCLIQLDWGFFVSHMVPVMATDDHGVAIGDPLKGERRLSWLEFLRQWKGQAIVIERNDAAGEGSEDRP